MADGVTFDLDGAKRIADAVRRVEAEARGRVRSPRRPPRIVPTLPMTVVRVTSSQLNSTTEYYPGELWDEKPNATNVNGMLLRLEKRDDVDPIWITTPFPGQILPAGFYYAARVGRYTNSAPNEREVYMAITPPQIFLGKVTSHVSGNKYVVSALRWKEDLSFVTNFGSSGFSFISTFDTQTRIEDADFEIGYAYELNGFDRVPLESKVWLRAGTIDTTVPGTKGITYHFTYDRHTKFGPNVVDKIEFKNTDVVETSPGQYTLYPLGRPTLDGQIPVGHPDAGSGPYFTYSGGFIAGPDWSFFSSDGGGSWVEIEADMISGDMDFGTW